MSVHEFAVSRLHSFRSEARIKVAPLMLIFGENNAGKSTLLRALAMMAASVGTSPSKAGTLDLRCDAVRGASFRDLRSRLDNVNELTLALTWAGVQGPEDTTTFRFMEETDGSHILSRLDVRIAAANDVALRVSLDQSEHYELVRGGAVEWTGLLPFAGIRPAPPSEVPQDVREALERIAKNLDGLRSSVSWLTAVRATVPRRRPVPTNEPQRKPDGAWLQEQLGREQLQSRRELIAAVSKELQAMFGCTLHVDLDDRDVLLRGAPGETELRLPLADLGEGITQVLPVITLCCMAELGDLGDDPILCIEQPEMHLHGDAERRLATFLSRVARSNPRPKLVLETHSDILLSAVLLEVAHGRLSRDQLALHWVERESPATESTVRPITVDEKGNPEGWPTGAFSQRSELARALFLARRA